MLPEVWDDIRLNLNGYKSMAIERVLAKCHITPNLNSKVVNNRIDMIIGIIWKDFYFQNKTGVYGLNPVRFLFPDALNGNSCLWLELQTLSYTSVLGCAACCITSKSLGIVSVERYWEDVKQKYGKKSNLGGASLEKRAILFTSEN